MGLCGYRGEFFLINFILGGVYDYSTFFFLSFFLFLVRGMEGK